MALFIQNEDLVSILLEYLNPNGRDIVHFKLVCSYCKELVEKVVPLHHIISIFHSIVNNNQIIPPLVLPSDYIIKSYYFELYLKKMEQQLQQEHFSQHIVTKFILLFHNHVACIKFLAICHNSLFLIQLAKKNYFPNSPLFQQLRHIHRLDTIMKQSTLTDNNEYMVDEYWIEADWSAAFVTPHTVYEYCLSSDISIPNDNELMNGIITNKELLIFLLLACDRYTCINVVNQLLSHPKWKEYKTDERLKLILLSHSHEDVEQRVAEEY